MSQVEDPKREGRLTSLTNAFKRRHDDRLVINDYRVGDIRAEKAVLVANGAILVGDLLAPEVIVSGLVYGYVASRRLIVAPGGQIWGDVYASSLELAPSGKINGWMCTLDAGTVDLLRAKELGKGDLPAHDRVELPVELLNRIQNSGADIEADQHESQRRSGIWRQLRSEAALALIARSEIEATFDQRLEQAVAGSAAQAAAERAGGTDAEAELLDAGDAEPPAGAAEKASDKGQGTAEVDQLRVQLRQATATAQKYYGELLWTRAELRAARRGDSDD